MAEGIVADGAGLADEAEGEAAFEGVGEGNAAGVQFVNSGQDDGDVGRASVVVVVAI